ncbi:MAG: DUF1614 domain-containing protein [Desulfurococcales archaeon]|nr:DUF1614 domain-containing protein [Desulfurococcales archaeon]
MKTPPSSPILARVYGVMAPLLVLGLIWAIGSAGLTLPPRYWALIGLALLLLAMSPELSFFNIVIREERETIVRPVIGTVVVFGLPLPIPMNVLEERTRILAVNIGGAVVPVVVGSILLYISYQVSGPRVIALFLVALLVTTLATFASSKVIPGVGIAVPWLVPPLASSTTVALMAGTGVVQAFVAYAAGVMGSLLGADVIRLLIDYDRLMSMTVFASIGGVGVFDGIFLTGALSLILTL